MTLSRLLLLPVCLSALFLVGCPTDGRRDSFDYLRSVVTFRVDLAADNHPFCDNQEQWDDVFASAQECRDTRKYRLRWERPEDTVGFSEYRIFLDTMPPDAPGLSWSDVRKDPSLAAFHVAGRPPAVDSVIFFISSTGSSAPTLTRDAPKIVRFDTNGRVDSTGRLVFAISTAYSQSGLNGQPSYAWMVTNDREAPFPLQPLYTPKARTLQIEWARPKDRTSFFDPDADSGIIRGYVIRVVRGGIRKTTPFDPVLTLYSVGGVNRTAEVVAEPYLTSRSFQAVRYWLPDSNRVFNRSADDFRDSLKVTLGNLTPMDTVVVGLWAVDVSGNATDSGSGSTQLLTDTTQPTTPVLQLVSESVRRNSFVYTFTASRDRVESGGGLVPASNPNANIREYRLSRRRIGGSAGGIASVDSLFVPTDAQRDSGIFTDTVRYLPPGAQYRLSVQAIDSTGFASEVATLDVSTLPASFTGADSLATCPAGFIPIPGGRFELGSNLGGDESGGSRGIGPYCIEPYEHRVGGTSGAFQTRVTWEQARDVCAAMSPANGSHLCTEAEWERACEGTTSASLVYGIQSEARDPGGVRFACNIGTNDSAMATNINLRDPTCLSYDGVFDMSGNFAEWVLDPYTASYPAGDTAIVGQPHTSPAAGSRRGFRGTHYLNTGQNPATMQTAGRCSNRDYVRQLRPKPFAGCTDSLYARLVVTYAGKSPRCFQLPDSLKGRSISSVMPGRDTNQVLILLPGQQTPVVYQMPLDTAYRLLKPVAALMTPRSLAIVTFENSETSEAIVDTLDATELVNASEASRAAVFAREAAPPWSVRKSGGVFEIRYLYSYAASQGTQARNYYSNKIIGFRCCSNPVPASLGKRKTR